MSSASAERRWVRARVAVPPSEAAPGPTGTGGPGAGGGQMGGAGGTSSSSSSAITTWVTTHFTSTTVDGVTIYDLTT